MSCSQLGNKIAWWENWQRRVGETFGVACYDAVRGCENGNDHLHIVLEIPAGKRVSFLERLVIDRTDFKRGQAAADVREGDFATDELACNVEQVRNGSGRNETLQLTLFDPLGDGLSLRPPRIPFEQPVADDIGVEEGAHFTASVSRRSTPRECALTPHQLASDQRPPKARLSRRRKRWVCEAARRGSLTQDQATTISKGASPRACVRLAAIGGLVPRFERRPNWAGM